MSFGLSRLLRTYSKPTFSYLDAKCVVDGHREKTLILLWQMIFHFQVSYNLLLFYYKSVQITLNPGWMRLVFFAGLNYSTFLQCLFNEEYCTRIKLYNSL